MSVPVSERAAQYANAQIAAILANELRLDAGTDGPDGLADPDGEVVHDLRVAVRRLRTLLRVLPSVVTEAPEELDDALRTWGALLGAVRDTEVVGQLLGEASPELAQRMEPRLAEERRTAVAAVAEAARSPRHAALLAVLARLQAARPRHAHRSVRKAEATAARRLDRAGTDPDRLHRARKALKRARYACEALGDGGRARELKLLQDRLGRHHDCIVVARWLADEPGTATLRRTLERWADQALHD
jgi:CHAD domain-containing protein